MQAPPRLDWHFRRPRRCTILGWSNSTSESVRNYEALLERENPGQQPSLIGVLTWPTEISLRSRPAVLFTLYASLCDRTNIECWWTSALLFVMSSSLPGATAALYRVANAPHVAHSPVVLQTGCACVGWAKEANMSVVRTHLYSAREEKRREGTILSRSRIKRPGGGNVCYHVHITLQLDVWQLLVLPLQSISSEPQLFKVGKGAIIFALLSSKCIK